MKIHLFEGRTAGVPHGNWGKFMVAVPDHDEWSWYSQLPREPGDLTRPVPLLSELGWGPKHIWVMDLQTGEGAIFAHGGRAKADLAKRRIWVCVLFEAFLTWLYKQDLATLGELDRLVDLDAEFSLYGYRRPGMWFDRRNNKLRILPGPGMCLRPWFD